MIPTLRERAVASAVMATDGGGGIYPCTRYLGSPLIASFTMYGTPSVIHFGAGAPLR